VTGSNDDLLANIVNHMTPKQRQQVSVKAYMGGYKARQGHAVPFDGHDQDTLPKAVRIGPEFPRKQAKK